METYSAEVLEELDGDAPGVKGVELMGNVVSWTMQGVTVGLNDLRDALSDAGLDSSLVRDLLPRQAFARAARKLAEKRVIRELKEGDKRFVRFQFTSEQRNGDLYNYNLESILKLDTETGAITSDTPGSDDLVKRATEQFDAATEYRGTSDVTRLLQRMFDDAADLFPVRDKGGVYFVPVKYEPFLDKVTKFLRKIGGRLSRFPVPTGTSHGAEAVRDSINRGLTSLVEEHEAAVAAFTDETRDFMFERAAKRVQEAKYKLDAYRAYLDETSSGLAARLDSTAAKLQERLKGGGEDAVA